MSTTHECKTATIRIRKIRRRQSAPQRPRLEPALTCNPLPSSLIPLDLSTTYSASRLASVRALVLEHLAELEESLSPPELSWGEEKVEEARVWASQAMEMLMRIREDVCSHLPEFPFETPTVEAMKTRFHDFTNTGLEDIRSHLPEISTMQSKLQDARSHLPEMPDFNHPMKYIPELSRHLETLHAHLSSASSCAGYPQISLPSTATVSELLNRILSSDLVPAVLHRDHGKESPLEKAARDMSVALKKSLDGARLVTYVDLPLEWRNNPFVSRGYR